MPNTTQLFSHGMRCEQWVTLLFDFIVTSLGNKDNFDGNVYLLQICSGLSQSIFQQELVPQTVSYGAVAIEQQHRQQIIKKLEQVLDVYLQSVFHLCELYANVNCQFLLLTCHLASDSKQYPQDLL